MEVSLVFGTPSQGLFDLTIYPILTKETKEGGYDGQARPGIVPPSDLERKVQECIDEFGEQ